MLPYLKDIDEQTRALIEPRLTGTAADLLRLVGLAATLALVQAYGGTDIYFPSDRYGSLRDPFRRLVDLVGPDNALVLTSEYSTSFRVYIPRCVSALNACRNAQMIRDYDALTQANGVNNPVLVIAKNYGMTIRNARRIINDTKKTRAALPRNSAQ